MALTDLSDLIGRAPGGRKLIAVVYADMAGYSRLIGLDDIGTLERLRTLRSTLIDPAINEHGGRIFQTGGDSLLIVFDSIDGAVQCAVKMQQQMPNYDGDQLSDQLIRFRIGINIGDVIAEGTDLHGDGVNVAARLQAECPPGGICVSRAVRDHVRSRLDLMFDELGPLSLKNILHPVEAFLLRLEPETAGPRLSPVPLPNPVKRNAKPPRPSVMVITLRNLGVPKEHEYLVEVIPEDISTVLPQHLGPIVVVSNDACRHRDSASPKDIARELGVVYVIQGSMRGIVDGGLAVNLQLVDVETGAQLWSERFDIGLASTANERNEITHRMALTLARKLNEDVNRRIEALPPEDWTPDDLVIRGGALLSQPVTFQGGSDPDHQKALGYFEQALAKAPDLIAAKIGIASVLLRNVMNGRSPSLGQDLARSEQLLSDVLRVNGQSVVAHNLMEALRLHQGRLNGLPDRTPAGGRTGAKSLLDVH